MKKGSYLRLYKIAQKSVDYFHRNKADLWFYFAFMLRGRDKIVICHIT